MSLIFLLWNLQILALLQKPDITSLISITKANSLGQKPSVLGYTPVRIHANKIASNSTKPPSNTHKPAVNIDIINFKTKNAS